jgi:hypothetical protein
LPSQPSSPRSVVIQGLSKNALPVIQLAEYSHPPPHRSRAPAAQAGVTPAVSQPPSAAADGAGWEFVPLLGMKTASPTPA